MNIGVHVSSSILVSSGICLGVGLCQGPAPAGSRGTLMMTASAIRKVKGERKRLDLPWFTQKANKAPGTELALFTEAAGALSVGLRRKNATSPVKMKGTFPIGS